MSRRLVDLGGGVIENYPRSAWSRIPAGVSMHDLWALVGPQVDRHMSMLPLWKVFCVVYFEGLAHGQAAEQRRAEAAAKAAT